MKSIIKYLLAALLTTTLLLVGKASAYDNFYPLNDIFFYDKEGGSSCSYSTSDVTINVDYAGNQLFSQAQMDQLRYNQPFYESSGSKNDVPWQILASIHFRETNLKRSGPSNGDGPYQILGTDYKIGDFTDDEFQEATDRAAEWIKNKSNGSDLTNPENVKDIFFTYNGRADSYIQQAINLGFTEEEAKNGEGSPYVMNRYDAKRDPSVEPTASNNTWGQIKIDHGPIEYPANVGHHGAFVYYSALSGMGSCNSTSVGSSGNPRDATSIQNAFAEYMKANGNVYKLSNGSYSYKLGINGCTTLSSWYIETFTSLTYGRGNGKEVVGNLSNSNSGLTVTDEPVAPAIFSVKGGQERGLWGASGVAPGHVGVVVSVDSAKKEATVVHTGSGYSNTDKRSNISTYKYPNSAVTFVNVGEYLK